MSRKKTAMWSNDIYRMTPRQFERACDAGVYVDVKVELIAGVPFVKPKNPRHGYAVYSIAETLRSIVRPTGRVLREEKTARLGRWMLIPDVAILEGPDTRYQHVWPRPVDFVMIVEVADTTYARDRGPKYRRYAACGIPQYWIVKLDERLIECHFDPVGRGKAARYRSCMTYGEGDQLPLFDSSFPVSAILPRVAEKPSP